MCVGANSFAQVQTYCTNIAGNISCTSYDHGASSQSYCTSIGGNLSCTTYDDDYDRVRIRQNYEAGQVIGTALGNTVSAAIAEYKAKKRIKQAKKEFWDQFVQDTIATQELKCETDPNEIVVVCRTVVFTLNQFLHRHQNDFVPDQRNVGILADALDKTAPDDGSTWTEETYEVAFRTIDKKQLDKKVYVGAGNDRKEW
jgi:hypothetical protein